MNALELPKPAEDEGYQWEKCVFGISAESMPRLSHLSLITATRKVIGLQRNLGWDPRNPKTYVAREMFDCVASYLDPEQASRLMFYCSIGTELDSWHQADGFFAIGEVYIYIDLKASRPPPNYRSNSILVIRRDCSGLAVWRVCKKIADALIEKTGPRFHRHKHRRY